MLKKILAIAGKPGLFRLVSHGNRNLIVETLDSAHKRMPAFGADKITVLGDIAMYTDAEEVPLKDVLRNISEREKGQRIAIDHKTASRDELADFMATALPNYDRDRVHSSDIRKLIQWYNILVDNGITDFGDAQQEPESNATEA